MLVSKSAIVCGHPAQRRLRANASVSRPSSIRPRVGRPNSRRIGVRVEAIGNLFSFFKPAAAVDPKRRLELVGELLDSCSERKPDEAKISDLVGWVWADGHWMVKDAGRRMLAHRHETVQYHSFLMGDVHGVYVSGNHAWCKTKDENGIAQIQTARQAHGWVINTHPWSKMSKNLDAQYRAASQRGMLAFAHTTCPEAVMDLASRF